MKTKLLCLGLFFTLACTVHPLHAQEPIIESLSRNGELVTMNMEPGSEATVEWAPTVTGPWSDTWAGLRGVEADSNRTVRVEVPMFYRVRSSIPANPDPARLVWIAPGTFLVGTSSSEVDRGNNEGPLMAVTLSRSYWIGKYEVTQAEYLDVIGSNPSEFTGDLNRPVETVSWNDATNYCVLLTARERSAGQIPLSYEYRLPTEAEWEYACRAGTTTRFSHGDDPDYAQLTDFAWYIGNSSSQTKAVGQKLPNPWGLYDMHGNVVEWCQDWYASSYPGGAVTDPMGSPTGSFRVFRGGSWIYDGRFCRSARRSRSYPTDSFNRIGFRVVLAPVQPEPLVLPIPNMVFIQPGTFIMGSPDDEVDRLTDEGPETGVTLSRSYWMGKYEVTQREYLDVVGSNPSQNTGDLNRPVETVSWIDAANYCVLLTARERSAGQISLKYEYRLPTEAEWEYACRAGTATRFSHGDDPGYTQLTAFAWYEGRNIDEGNNIGTKAVGQRVPNPWGLYDMHGNVYEWCQDWYASSYPGGAVTDPMGSPTSSLRVARGGDWNSLGRNCRSAFRRGNDPSSPGYVLGFRVVLAPVRP